MGWVTVAGAVGDTMITGGAATGGALAGVPAGATSAVPGAADGEEVPGISVAAASTIQSAIGPCINRFMIDSCSYHSGRT
jgi:hypothetical protein